MRGGAIRAFVVATKAMRSLIVVLAYVLGGAEESSAVRGPRGSAMNKCLVLRVFQRPRSAVRAFLARAARLLVSYTTLARRFDREGFCARITALQVAS